MTERQEGRPVFRRSQAFGCLGLGVFSLAIAALCIGLGIRCLTSHGAFDCIGLVTVFPLTFAVIGLGSLAVGLQRFTTASREPERATPANPFAAWQSMQLPRATNRAADLPGGVIYLPGRSPENQAEETENDATTDGGGS